MVQSLTISTAPNSGSMDGLSSPLETPPPAYAVANEESASFSEVPITALSKTTQRQLSASLNLKKILRSEEGYERDWRGIAALAQLKGFCDETALSGDDSIARVMQLWCSHNPKTATLAHLERFLGIIDRWDVLDDIYENLVEDTKVYNAKLHQKSLTLSDEVDATNNATARDTSADNYANGSDPNILTKDDVLRAQKGLPPQKYDAFVLFADADISYAAEMLAKLEDNAQNNFKLCLKDRDLLAGVSFAHVALMQLIEQRCKHLIVILTEDFMKSPENKFLVNYTQALQIEHKTRKIIPLIYDDSVVIPRTLKIYTHLKYSVKSNGLVDFWGRLASSIRNVNISTETPPPIYTKETCSISTSSRPKDPLKAVLANLPTPPTEIPSININGNVFVPEDDDVPKKKERNKFKKRSSLRQNGNGNGAATYKQLDDPLLRNAHSTSQLHALGGGAGYLHDPNGSSISDLSTTSGYSEPKKKKKWPSKLFRKVFSRSSSKLQEPA